MTVAEPEMDAPQPEIGHPADSAPLSFLKLFYPFHYAVGMTVEKHLAGNSLSRHQTVILWILKSKGRNGRTLPRKIIAQMVKTWYNLGNPAISKVLRKMAQQELIEIEDSANSRREKCISLTDTGADTINEMIARTENFITQISDKLTDAQILNGMDFIERVGEIVEFELESPDPSTV